MPKELALSRGLWDLTKFNTEIIMSAKEVKFGVDARDRMLRGVEILNNAVKVTLGPRSSVRRLQAGLQSFLSMRRIEARRKNESAFRLRFFQSLASLRQRLSHAMVRSTIQRFGKTTNPLT